MSRLLLFNPEHDYALANGTNNYTPPASVVKLGAAFQLMPMIWANNEDYVLLADNKILGVKDDRIYPEYSSIKDKISKIEPWGWDEATRHRLRNIGVQENLLPSDEEISVLRRLSHRRISILCNEYLGSPLLPREFFTVEETMEFVKENCKCYLKMPWSSGGRGVLATKELTPVQIKEWITGCIRRQKSVIAEKAVEKTIDFASLWTISNGDAVFEGFATFLSDGRGKYDGNLYGPQKAIHTMILGKAPSLSNELIERQKEFLTSHIAPHYNGKLGIDMMADTTGMVYPCVEINVRRTMGHVAMEYQMLNESQRERFKSVPLQLIPI